MTRLGVLIAGALILGHAAPATGASPGVVAREGEVLILEGDDEIVGEAAAGLALTLDALVELLDRVYQHLPDEFDMIVVSTTFVDALNPGAYFMPDPPTPSSRSLGFIDMNQVGLWADLFAPVLAQEFSHAWLAFTRFIDPVTGLLSDELLGRDLAHWSARVDTDGSFQDGVDWVDNGNGTFTAVGYMERFSALDLWTMGFAADDEVPDIRILRTDAIARDRPPPLGLTITADSTTIRLADIIAAGGPQPPWQDRQHDFRLAFVLVTAPGQTAEAARPVAAALDAQRRAWTEAIPGWLWQRGTMCTAITAPCDVAHLAFATAATREAAASDDDSVIEPGEAAAIDVTWRNTGTMVASGGEAALEPPAGWTSPGPIEVADVEAGADATTSFVVEVPATAACGERVALAAVARLGALSWRGTLALTPGLVEGPIETFQTGAGWVADADASDTATSGSWAHGAAERVLDQGRVLQPPGGAEGGGDAAWWTGPTMGADWRANDLDGGVTTLTSPPLDLRELRRPALRYRLWYVALDFNVTPPAPTDDDPVVVEASDDAGATWHELDRVSGTSLAWASREAALAGVVDTRRPVRLRFTARDDGAASVVEVGLDDVQVVSLSDACATADEPTGCGCGATGGPPPFGIALLMLLVRRRRRHAGRP